MPTRELNARPSYDVRIGRTLVRTTVAFDSYWRFAAARQEVFFNRLAQRPPPWTSDPIIAAHRFTNVYRASDRVSQYLIRHVILENGSFTTEDIFFRIILFKLFNRIETWEGLLKKLGRISWSDYSFKTYSQALDDAFSSGKTVYSAAYIMPSPAFGEIRKHSNHLRLLEHMMADGAHAKVAVAKTLEGIFRVLRGYRSLGNFLAFQLAIDINYSDLIDFSEMDFVVAGPGAHDGISKCFEGLGGPRSRRRYPRNGGDRAVGIRASRTFVRISVGAPPPTDRLSEHILRTEQVCASRTPGN